MERRGNTAAVPPTTNGGGLGAGPIPSSLMNKLFGSPREGFSDSDDDSENEEGSRLPSSPQSARYASSAQQQERSRSVSATATDIERASSKMMRRGSGGDLKLGHSHKSSVDEGVAVQLKSPTSDKSAPTTLGSSSMSDRSGLLTHERKPSLSNSRKGGDEATTQYNLDIALSTIQELQMQLVHCNRTIEQLAAENVALTRDLKKARRQVGKVEAKVVKARQVASDITPGARKILQETIEENTRTLNDFLETMQQKGAVERLGGGANKKGSGVAAAPATEQQPPQQQQPAVLSAAALTDVKTMVDKLADLKRQYEKVVEERRANPPPPPVCGVCVENRRREADAKRQQKDDEVATLRARVNALDAELVKTKRELRAVHEKEASKDVDDRKQDEERMATAGAQYGKLQKHALFLSMQNDQFREEIKQMRNNQDRLKSSVAAAKEMYRRSDNFLEQTLSEHVTEIANLRTQVKDKEDMLRIQMRIKTTIASELQVKRREVRELQEVVDQQASIAKANNTRIVTVEPRPYKGRERPKGPGSVFGTFGKSPPPSPSAGRTSGAATAGSRSSASKIASGSGTSE